MLEMIVASSIKVIIVMLAVLTGCAYATYMERKVVAFMQHRIGPSYAGPYGLLQPIADAIKMAFKEDVVPDKVERITYALAPIASFVPSLLVFAVVPFSADFTLVGRQVTGVISDLNIGILFVFAITSLGVYGIVLAGWSSGSKYSLMGGIRSSAQMISYEISYGLSIVGVILIANTLSLRQLVEQQDTILHWYIWKQPLGFLLYLTCAIAETNRLPFDLPEAESELVGGYHTEYSSFRFAMFFIGEYANMIAVSCVGTTLFFGGWQGPFLPAGLSVIWFVIKVFCFMFFYIWLRATFPRFRYDQLMNFGWKVLFPLAVVNLLVTGLIVLW
ncbi:NADH-quinone oxidoreductase subunit NuoH [candidate division GN15 bacterium]|uniref:NADH-quinone oxidoreductase subunit H n=1 Tax=candidate division GN15 bacterium TaxID=2072418 RepID=A0A855XA83_9BACT|nr:MAG: NADH-quinone oxidoreductase subunit NuoH [candidate division GN15 bacterium]